MAIPERYLQKDSWPHQFVKTGSLKPGNDGLPIQEHFCVYCQQIWKMGQEPRPVGTCPARKDKSEYKRLLG